MRAVSIVKTCLFFLIALADDHWLAVQILSTAAVILSFLSLTVVVYAFIKRRSTSIHWVQIVGGVLLLITCKCCIITLVMLNILCTTLLPICFILLTCNIPVLGPPGIFGSWGALTLIILGELGSRGAGKQGSKLMVLGDLGSPVKK